MPHWVAVSLAIDLIRICVGLGLAMMILAPRGDADDSPGVLPRPVDPRSQMFVFMVCVAAPEYVIFQMVFAILAHLAQRK